MSTPAAHGTAWHEWPGSSFLRSTRRRCRWIWTPGATLNGATLGRGGPRIDRPFDDIVDLSAISRFPDTEVKSHPWGMFLRLPFVMADRIEPDVLLVEEILAVGDEPFAPKALVRIQKTVQGRSHSDTGQPDIAHRRAPLRPGHRVARGTLCARRRPQRCRQNALTDRTGLIS